MLDTMLLAVAVLVGLLAATAVGWRSRHVGVTTFLVAFACSYAAIAAFVFALDTWTYWRHGGVLDFSSSWLHDVFVHLVEKTPLMLFLSFVALSAPAMIARARRVA